MKRHTHLGRKGPLSRKTRIRPANPKRKAKAYARNYGERGDAVRAMGCLCVKALRSWDFDEQVTEDTPGQCDAHPIQAAHSVARGMGGAKGDRRDLVPLCGRHHAEAGERGTSQRAAFEHRYDVSLGDEAHRIAVELDERGLP